MSNRPINNVLSLTKSLKNKRAIRDGLNTINKRRKVTFEELDRISEKFSLFGKKAAPLIINSFLEMTDENILLRYLYIIEYLNYDEFINPLIYTVLKRELSDSFKANAMNALYSFDIDISSPIFTRLANDADKMIYSFDDSFFEKAASDEDIFVSSLTWFSGLQYHKKMIILSRLSDVKHKGKIAFLEVVSKESDYDIALNAIDFLGKIKEREALRSLDRLGLEHPKGERGARALRAAKKLRLLGLNKSFMEEDVSEAGSYTCYVSMIDFNGNYVIWISRHIVSKQPREALCILVNESEGIIDCFGNSNMSRKEFSSLISKAKEEDHFVKVDYEYTKKLVQNALSFNRESGSPPPLEFLYRKKIFDSAISPEKHVPAFEGFDLKKIAGNKSLIKKTSSLVDICGISSWNILSRKIFSYAEKFTQIKENFKAPAKRLKIEKLIENIFYHLVLPEIDTIIEKLYFTADLLQYDRKNRKHVKLILCAAENLSDPTQKPMNNPFITSFIMANIENAVEMSNH